MDDKLKLEIVALIKELQQQDSIEIGNSKTGVIKVYVDFEKTELANKKILNAILLLQEHRQKVLSE
jgi:allophanate hydrolase subunit 1